MRIMIETRMIIIYILIINSSIGFINGNYIRIKFFKDKYKSSLNIENAFYSNMVTDVYFGTPPFKIYLQISTDSPYFIIKGSNPNNPNEYKQEKSSSFYFIRYGHSYNYKDTYIHAIFFREDFKFNNNKTLNLESMMYWSKHLITNNYGLIGLQLKDIKFGESNIFINQLYNKSLIKNKMFSLIYEDEDKGELFIGEYPHNKTNKTGLFKGKFFKSFNNNFITNGAVYGVVFTDILFQKKYFLLSSEKIEEKNYICIFSNSYRGYIGSRKYKEYIYESFFKYKIKDKSCWIQNIENDKFFGYVCARSVDTSSIPDIKLYHKELDYVFQIKNEDMWEIFNNIKYFLIYFNYIDQYSWTMGQKFMEKYTFVFDGGNNITGFYYDEKTEDINDYYSYSVLYFILLLIILLSIGIGIYIYYRYFCFSKKKQTEEGTELEDILDKKEYSN